MNVSDIDWLFENIFTGGGGGFPDDEGPEPINKRFNWVDPVSGKRPPEIPPGMMPGPEDMEEEPAGAEVPIAHKNPADDVGTYSLHDLIPPEELATIDQLLDLKLRAQRSSGANAAALDKEFQAHRTEFESILKKIVDVVLEGTFDRTFDKTMKSINGKTDRVNRDLTNMFKSLPKGQRRRPAAGKGRPTDQDEGRAERGAGRGRKFGE